MIDERPTSEGSRKVSGGDGKRSPLRFRLAADDADLPADVTLAREAHEDTRFGSVSFSKDKVRRIARTAF